VAEVLVVLEDRVETIKVLIFGVIGVTGVSLVVELESVEVVLEVELESVEAVLVVELESVAEVLVVELELAEVVLEELEVDGVTIVVTT